MMSEELKLNRNCELKLKSSSSTLKSYKTKPHESFTNELNDGKNHYYCTIRDWPDSHQNKSSMVKLLLSDS